MYDSFENNAMVWKEPAAERMLRKRWIVSKDIRSFWASYSLDGN